MQDVPRKPICNMIAAALPFAGAAISLLYYWASDTSGFSGFGITVGLIAIYFCGVLPLGFIFVIASLIRRERFFHFTMVEFLIYIVLLILVSNEVYTK